MSRLNRILELHQLLSARRQPVALADICQVLECSDSTARRTLQYLRDQCAAPLEYDRERNGWRYSVRAGSRQPMPGIWFSPEELYALLVSH